jgi:hypothetical protein
MNPISTKIHGRFPAGFPAHTSAEKGEYASSKYQKRKMNFQAGYRAFNFATAAIPALVIFQIRLVILPHPQAVQGT